jgi:hypothetical protein
MSTSVPTPSSEQSEHKGVYYVAGGVTLLLLVGVGAYMALRKPSVPPASKSGKSSKTPSTPPAPSTTTTTDGVGQPTTPPPPPTALPACLARTAPIYVGCGYAYGSRDSAKAQCASEPTVQKFIGDGIPNSDPCLLARSTTMYQGCGNVYASKDERNKQCPNVSDPDVKWIGDGLRS